MALDLIAKISSREELTEMDEKYNVQGEPTYVDISQATDAQELLRSSLNSEVVRVYRQESEDGTIEFKQHWDPIKLRHREIYATLVGSNITYKGKPLFVFGTKDGEPYLKMTEPEFLSAVGKLPSDWVIAIHKRVLKLNPQWSETGNE